MITCEYRAEVLDAPCGQAATHRVARSLRSGADGWYMCAGHAAETKARHPRWTYRGIHR